ncbi:FAD-binding domain-containing protein [Peniophora sp. CONT]|nr:FAD-binding domain-containing protein [Peniophora sp. CONT]
MILTYLITFSSLAFSVAAGSIADACAQIQVSISGSSEVFYPGSDGYAADIEHWSLASTQNSTCSVEPGTVEDVSVILKVIGETRVPFAVKSGGHGTNPGFASTQGIQIAMSRFSHVTLGEDKSTVAVGAGCFWDDAYNALNGTGRGVVGARAPGVGVGGFILGGGYAYHTSQYGLAMDNVVAYDVVLPNASIATITRADEDLWFALRGAGAANFGIVTTFHLVTHPQGDVWGGIFSVGGSQFSALTTAIASFSANNTDSRAAVVTGYQYGLGAAFAYNVLFYDGPTPPAGIFDDWLVIPTLSSDLMTRDFASFIQSLELITPIDPGANAYFGSVNVLDYPSELLEYMQELDFEVGEYLTALDPSFFLSIYVEPFSLNYFEDAAIVSPAAYPPLRDRALLPSIAYYGFKNTSLTDVMLKSLQHTIEGIREKAIELGQDVAHIGEYANYALFTTPAVDIYGPENLVRLQDIQKAVDPDRVFNLTGGFRIREADVEGKDVGPSLDVAYQVPLVSSGLRGGGE